MRDFFGGGQGPAGGEGTFWGVLGGEGKVSLTQYDP